LELWNSLCCRRSPMAAGKTVGTPTCENFK
jgi:hypothetical protein